jgi:hypothetical protein
MDMPSYEIGYREGENSGNADWILALDVLPFDVNSPNDVIVEVELLRTILHAIKGAATYGPPTEETLRTIRRYADGGLTTKIAPIV